MWNVVTSQNDSCHSLANLVLGKVGLAKHGNKFWPNLDLAKVGPAFRGFREFRGSGFQVKQQNWFEVEEQILAKAESAKVVFRVHVACDIGKVQIHPNCDEIVIFHPQTTFIQNHFHPKP